MCTLNILSLSKKLLTKGLLFKVLAITLLSTAVSYANLCPIGYGGAECEDMPDYTGSAEGFSGNAATESDCERLGYSDYGASPSNKAPNSVNDIWPAKARKNNANNTAEYHCDRCEIGGNIILNSQGKARWSCYRLCQDVSAATPMPNVEEDAPYRRHFVNNQKDCDTVYGKFDSGKSKTHFEWVTQNVCGKCVDLQCDGLVVIDKDGNNQAPQGCYKVEKTYTMEDGTVCANAKQWEKMSAEWKEESELLSGCYDVEEAPTASGGKCYKQTEMSTVCAEGYVWNDYSGNPRTDQPNCQCVPMLCPEGSSTSQDKEGCYDYIDTGAKSGNQICWEAVEKTACPAGQRRDDSCNCVDVDCEEGGLKETCVTSCEGGKRVTCDEEEYEGKKCYRETVTDDETCNDAKCGDKAGYVNANECTAGCTGGVMTTCELDSDPVYAALGCVKKNETTCQNGCDDVSGVCKEAACSDKAGYVNADECTAGCTGGVMTTCELDSDPVYAALGCVKKTESTCAYGCDDAAGVCKEASCSDFNVLTLDECTAQKGCKDSATALVCQQVPAERLGRNALNCYELSEQICSSGCVDGSCSDKTCSSFNMQSFETDPTDSCSGKTLTKWTKHENVEGTTLTCWTSETIGCSYGCMDDDCTQCPDGYNYDPQGKAENYSKGYETALPDDGNGICYKIISCPADTYTQKTHQCGTNETFVGAAIFSGTDECGTCECAEDYVKVGDVCKADKCDMGYKEGDAALGSCSNKVKTGQTEAGTACYACNDCPSGEPVSFTLDRKPTSKCEHTAPLKQIASGGGTSEVSTAAGNKCYVCDECPDGYYRDGDDKLNDGKFYEEVAGVETYSGKKCYKLSDCDDSCQTYINQGYTLIDQPTSAVGTYQTSEGCCVPHYKCADNYKLKYGKCLSDVCPELPDGTPTYLAADADKTSVCPNGRGDKVTSTQYGSECYVCKEACSCPAGTTPANELTCGANFDKVIVNDCNCAVCQCNKSCGANEQLDLATCSCIKNDVCSFYANINCTFVTYYTTETNVCPSNRLLEYKCTHDTGGTSANTIKWIDVAKPNDSSHTIRGSGTQTIKVCSLSNINDTPSVQFQFMEGNNSRCYYSTTGVSGSSGFSKECKVGNCCSSDSDCTNKVCVGWQNNCEAQAYEYYAQCMRNGYGNTAESSRTCSEARTWFHGICQAKEKYCQDKCLQHTCTATRPDGNVQEPEWRQCIWNDYDYQHCALFDTLMN